MRNGKYKTGLEGNIHGKGFASFGGIQSNLNKVRIDHQPAQERIDLLVEGKCGQISKRVRAELAKNAETLPPEAVANAYVNQNVKLDEAKEIFDACLKTNPGNFQARWGRALLWCRLDDFASAFEDFTKALSIHEAKKRPKQYDLWAETGFRIGKTPEQIYDRLEEWLRTDPENAAALALASKLQVQFPIFARICLPDILQKIHPVNRAAGIGVTDIPHDQRERR